MGGVVRGLVRALVWLIVLALAWTRRDALLRLGRGAVEAVFGEDAPTAGERLAAAGRSAASGVGAVASQIQGQVQDRIGGARGAAGGDAAGGAAGYPDALDAVEDVKSRDAPTQAADETLAVQRELAGRAPAGAGRMPTTGPSGDDGGAAASEGSVPGDGSRECPTEFPIKGNASSMIYHVPGTASYANTIAEFCFATTEAAEAAGYHPPRR